MAAATRPDPSRESRPHCPQTGLTDTLYPKTLS